MKKKILSKLTKYGREIIIDKLIEDYTYYINDSDDEELQKIFNAGCFTVGSMNYYNELDRQVKKGNK